MFVDNDLSATFELGPDSRKVRSGPKVVIADVREVGATFRRQTLRQTLHNTTLEYVQTSGANVSWTFSSYHRAKRCLALRCCW